MKCEIKGGGQELTAMMLMNVSKGYALFYNLAVLQWRRKLSTIEGGDSCTISNQVSKDKVHHLYRTFQCLVAVEPTNSLTLHTFWSPSSYGLLIK